MSRKRDVDLGRIVSGRLATIATHLQHFLIYIGKDTEQTDFTPIRPQRSLPNQRNQYVTIFKTVKTARFVAVYGYG